MAGLLQSASNDERMRSLAHGAFECPGKVRRTQMDHDAQVFQPYRLIDMFLNVLTDTAYLPGRQPSVRDAIRIPDMTVVDFRLEQRKSATNESLCDVAISPNLTSCVKKKS
jgi:hypothetical protein